MTTTTNRWLTIAQLAKEYQIGKTKQYQLRKEGKIPFSKIDGDKSSIRYDRKLINEWLESKRVN